MAVNLSHADFAGLSDNGIQFLLDLVSELTSIKTQFNQLRLDHNSHTHGGVTAGGANTAAPTATTATALAAPDGMLDPLTQG